MGETLDLKLFIKNKLLLLDESNYIYNDLITCKNVTLLTNDNINEILFKKDDAIIYKNKASLLGLFDVVNNTWLWSWSLPLYSYDETNDARSILNYGLMLEPMTNLNIHNYIKPHLINSRLYFENDIFLDIHLGLSLYIIKKGKFIFKKTSDTNKNIIIYYLVY